MNTSAALNKTPALTLALRLLGGVLVVTVAAAAALPIIERVGGLPPVSRLEITGDLPADAVARVHARLLPLLQGQLLSLDMDALRFEAQQEPWVAQARVERLWPDAVRVSLVQRHAIARWGEGAVLTDTAYEFKPPMTEIPASLPRLSGPPGRAAEVLQVYQALHQQLGSTPYVPVELSLGDRGDWIATTAEGLELRLGRGDPALKVAVLLTAAAQPLQSRLSEMAYLDLRYTNGFAVGWASPRDSRSPVDFAARASAPPRTAGQGVVANTEVAPGMAKQMLRSKGDAP